MRRWGVFGLVVPLVAVGAGYVAAVPFGPSSETFVEIAPGSGSMASRNSCSTATSFAAVLRLRLGGHGRRQLEMADSESGRVQV